MSDPTKPETIATGASTATSVAMAVAMAILESRLARARPFNIGFPTAVDIDYVPMARLLAGQPLNNVGDPWVDGIGRNHTKALERWVVGFLADLFRAPPQDRWGYVTSGGSEGNLYALHLARTRYPDAVVYYSSTAHPSVGKAVDLLGLASVVVGTDEVGELDYHHLAGSLVPHQDRPAVVVANIGTTMSEAVDDVRRIGATLDALDMTQRHIHADAALAGIPLALLHPDARPGFDFADGADSVTVSGHKFVGTPMPCGVVVVKASHRRFASWPLGYTASPDSTVTGSRNGHAPLLLWYALRHHGVDGLHARAERSRALASYTRSRLAATGWPVYRSQPNAFTVVLRTPPSPVTDRWALATSDGWSHIVCMPGIHRDRIDAFVADLTVAIASAADRPATTTPECLGSHE